MSDHRFNRLGVEHAGSDEFWADDNLNWEPANPADYGIGPNETAQHAGLRAQAVVWALDDVEVDSGSRGGTVDADEPAAPVSAFSSPPAAAVPSPQYEPPAVDMSDAALDRLVNVLADKLMKRLGG